MKHFAFALLTIVALGLMAACATNNPQPVLDNTPPSGMSPGCYVDVYEANDFGGQYVRIWGPATYHNLNFNGKDFSGIISSTVVGPNAHVRLTSEPRGQGKELWLVPNQEVRDLGQYNFQDQTRTIEIFDRPPYPSGQPTIQ